MMRSLSKHFYYTLFTIGCCLAFIKPAAAQMENDGIMIPKNYLCPGIMYGTSDWKNYWEGTFKRDNGNLGTVNTKMYSVMVTYGITNNLIATLGLPYVTTHASAGTLEGQKGLQDLSLNLKWRALKINTGANSAFSVFASVTGSIPASNYQADFLPLAIGSHSKNFTGRALVDFHAGKYFITGSGAYTTRSNITIDRTSYYTTQLIYSNQVELPNMDNFNLRTGYRSRLFIAEVILDKSTSLGGFDIRKNDMPFPSNRMNFTSAGANFRFRLKSFYALELTAGDDYVFRGRNVGQSNMIHGGLSYIFGLTKNKAENNNDKNFYKN